MSMPTTVAGAADPAQAPATPSSQPRRVTSAVTGRDVTDLVGAAVTALSLAVLLFGRLAPLSGGLGFVVTTYVLFIASYAMLASIGRPGTVTIDKIATVLLWSLALLLLAALALVIGYTLWSGHSAIAHLNFFTQDMSQAGPLSPLSEGGVIHAMVGTLWMIGIALVITVPLGLSCAVYLSQVGGRGAGLVRTVVEAMTALPSIVAGLFIFATWVLILGLGRSGLAAALALSTMMLPIIIRAADVVLRVVPGNLKEASEALGAPRWRTVLHVVLPTARSGLATSVILGAARGIGETSPVLLTAGYTVYLNTNPVNGPMVSLPLVVFELIRSSSQPAYIARGFGAAAVLMLLVLGLFVLARIVGGRGPGVVTPRRARRIEHRSARDLLRFADRSDARQPRYDEGADLLADGPWTSSEGRR
jgi:phosphate transport system permease protein